MMWLLEDRHVCIIYIDNIFKLNIHQYILFNAIRIAADQNF